MKVYIFLLVSVLFCIPKEENEWKKRKEKSGIVVYTRTKQDSSIDEFKAIATFQNITLVEVLDVILDVDSYPEWIPDCKHAEILFKEEKHYDIHYFTIKAPWPVKNRDAIYEMTTTLSNNQKYARVVLKPRGDYIREKRNFVRLYKGSGFWELKAKETNTVVVKYQFMANPGGKIPTWLANSSVVSNPFKTLINLKKILNK